MKTLYLWTESYTQTAIKNFRIEGFTDMLRNSSECLILAFKDDYSVV